MALPANVVTCVNAICLKISQRDPGSNATSNNTRMTAMLNDWPNQTADLFGPGKWIAERATNFCNYWSGQGVDVTALRTLFGI